MPYSLRYGYDGFFKYLLDKRELTNFFIGHIRSILSTTLYYLFLKMSNVNYNITLHFFL